MKHINKITPKICISQNKCTMSDINAYQSSLKNAINHHLNKVEHDIKCRRTKLTIFLYNQSNVPNQYYPRVNVISLQNHTGTVRSNQHKMNQGVYVCFGLKRGILGGMNIVLSMHTKQQKPRLGEYKGQIRKNCQHCNL